MTSTSYEAGRPDLWELRRSPRPHYSSGHVAIHRNTRQNNHELRRGGNELCIELDLILSHKTVRPVLFLRGFLPIKYHSIWYFFDDPALPQGIAQVKEPY